MYSIYHFFARLIANKAVLATTSKIQPEQFDTDLFSSYNSRGKFPDIVLRLNKDDPDIQGGELIDLIDCNRYIVGSFNSTIPTGKNDLTKLISPRSKMWREMQQLGEEIGSHPVRDVFYLVRGKQAGKVKICLVHGDFFETISETELIKGALQQVLEETVSAEVDNYTKAALLEGLSKREIFNRTHHIDGSSLSIRIDIETETNSAGNILRYPEIEDNTLSFVVPSHTPEQDEIEFSRLSRVLGQNQFDQLAVKRIKHLLNGDFLVFQTPLFIDTSISA